MLGLPELTNCVKSEFECLACLNRTNCVDSDIVCGRFPEGIVLYACGIRYHPSIVEMFQLAAAVLKRILIRDVSLISSISSFVNMGVGGVLQRF